MCKCRILIEADLDGYMLDNMMLEEMALQDVIQATTDDFACIVIGVQWQTLSTMSTNACRDSREIITLNFGRAITV